MLTNKPDSNLDPKLTVKSDPDPENKKKDAQHWFSETITYIQMVKVSSTKTKLKYSLC
jgi:hypothetical protein